MGVYHISVRYDNDNIIFDRQLLKGNGKEEYGLDFAKKKLIHAYGPMKKTVIMGINQTIERIKLTANLKIIGIKRP